MTARIATVHIQRFFPLISNLKIRQNGVVGCCHNCNHTSGKRSYDTNTVPPGSAVPGQNRTSGDLPSQVQVSAGVNPEADSAIPHYLQSSSKEALATVLKNMVVYEEFLSENEEYSLLSELEPYMKRLRYEFSHWDDAIHGYRETEKSNWNLANKSILQRVSQLAFVAPDKPLKHVHVLDISKEGYIKPHVDSVRFCGDTIAGLSLLSSSIMRLVCEENKEKFVDILLKQRSLYLMKGEARYKYTHEILPDNLSYFKNVHVPRDRRISVICRNEPQHID